MSKLKIIYRIKKSIKAGIEYLIYIFLTFRGPGKYNSCRLSRNFCQRIPF